MDVAVSLPRVRDANIRLCAGAGITIGHMLRFHPKPDRWKLKMYIPMLMSFFFGAAACRDAYNHSGKYTLLYPAIFMLLLGLTYIYVLARIRRQPFHKVLLRRVSAQIMTPHSPTHAASPTPNKEVDDDSDREQSPTPSLSPTAADAQQVNVAV